MLPYKNIDSDSSQMKSSVVYVVSILLKRDDTSFTSVKGLTSIGIQEEIQLLTLLNFWIET